MKLCHNCGSQLTDDQMFCGECGTAVTPASEGGFFCGTCGLQLQKGTVFCPNCGNKVEANADLGMGEMDDLSHLEDTVVLGNDNPADFYNEQNTVLLENESETEVLQNEFGTTPNGNGFGGDPNRYGFGSEQMGNGFAQGPTGNGFGVQSTEKKQKKSKKPLIISIVSLAVVLLLVGTYIGVVLLKQGSVESKYKKVNDKIVDNNIVLSDENKNNLSKAKEDMSSFNIVAIIGAEGTLDDLSDVVDAVKTGNDKLADYQSRFDTIKSDALTKGVYDIVSSDINACQTEIDNFKTAIADNKKEDIESLEKTIEDKLSALETRISDNSGQVQTGAQNVYDQLISRFDTADKTAKNKKVDKDSIVKEYRSDAEESLGLFKAALEKGDLSNVDTLQNDAETDVKAYEDAVEEAEAEEDEDDWQDEYVVLDSAIYEYNYNPFSGMGLERYEELQLLIIAKNEIYAKYGYHFITDELNEYFNGTSWYEDEGLDQDEVRAMMTKEEQKNTEYFAKLIKEYDDVSDVYSDGSGTDYTKGDFFSAYQYENTVEYYIEEVRY